MIKNVGKLFFLRRNKGDAFTVLSKLGRWILPMYRFSWPQMDWWKNESFNKYLEQFGERDGFNTQRRWMLGQLMRLTDGIEGDTAECGVYKGCGSWAMLQINQKSSLKKHHYIFDSFEGVSAPGLEDGAHWGKGDLSAGEMLVRESLGVGEYSLYKGWIPDRFAEVKNCRFSFVHVDVDLYQPTKDSIEFFYEKLNKGGIFLCDDYGFDSCPGATKAADEFLESRQEKMIALADGGGFFIKGVVTSRENFDATG